MNDIFEQGYGKSLWLMHGMFRANGRCGYIKKPDFLLKAGPDTEIFDPKADLLVKTTLRVSLQYKAIIVYSFIPLLNSLFLICFQIGHSIYG